MTTPHRELVRFADGEHCDHVAARGGARDILNENRRLRKILRALSRDDLGEGAVVEIGEHDGRLCLTVCCASRSEDALMDAVVDTMRTALAGAPADGALPDGWSRGSRWRTGVETEEP